MWSLKPPRVRHLLLRYAHSPVLLGFQMTLQLHVLYLRAPFFFYPVDKATLIHRSGDVAKVATGVSFEPIIAEGRYAILKTSVRVEAEGYKCS